MFLAALFAAGLSQFRLSSHPHGLEERSRLLLLLLAIVFAYCFFQLVGHSLLAPLAAEPPVSLSGSVGGVALLILAAFIALCVLQLCSLGGSRSRWMIAAYVHVQNGLYANAVADRVLGGYRREVRKQPAVHQSGR